MSAPTPADELRTAATKLRTLAAAAMHDDRPQWQIGHTLSSKTRVVVDNQKRPSLLIETWAPRREQVDDYLVAFASPVVAFAVADWLDQAAHHYDAGVQAANDVFRDNPARHTAFLTTGPGAPSEHALAVARAITQAAP
ncbi:hypothetical protein [Streptomyces rochei]|uniref:hypothetical protein n=1 Tax=Streptomyces rochei TaxID=1928 RepID=UPI00363FB9DB